MCWQSTALFAVNRFIIGPLVKFIGLIDRLIKRRNTFWVNTWSIKLQSYLTNWWFTLRAGKQKGFVFSKGKLFPFFLNCVLLRIVYQLDTVDWAFLGIDAEVLSNLEITGLLTNFAFFFCYIDGTLFEDKPILKDGFAAIFFSGENFHIDAFLRNGIILITSAPTISTSYVICLFPFWTI